MNSNEFNKKYNDYLEVGFYGNVLQEENIINYLDKEFEKAIEEHPNFKYQQIKWKWDEIRVYTNIEDLDIKWSEHINKKLI
tara:strand:- start:1678 stop:1920 length:243 start_codon:yes stop_codon:yes gene_type:complete